MDPVRNSLAVSVILQFQEDSLLLARLSITFTSNGRGEFVPRDFFTCRWLFIIFTPKLDVQAIFYP